MKRKEKKNIKRPQRIQRQAVKNRKEKSKDKSVVRMIRFTRLQLESGKLIVGYCYFHLISSPATRIFKSFPIPVQNVFPCLIVMADIQGGPERMQNDFDH